MTEYGDEREETLPDEIPEEEQFNPNDDTPEETSEEEQFNPNDDTPDEIPEEEQFDPNDDTPDEIPEEEQFDPNDDTPDEIPEEEQFDPNDDTPDEIPEEELFDPNDDTPNEPSKEELFNPKDDNPDEYYNPSSSGQISVVIPENPEQEQENEPETEEKSDQVDLSEEEIKLLNEEGEPLHPDSQEVVDLIADLEESGLLEPEPELGEIEETEGEAEIESDDMPEAESETETETKSEISPENDQENQPDSQPEDLELLNTEGEPITDPHIVPPELIPLKDALEKLYEEQQNQEKNLEEDPKEISKQEPEIISKQESEPDSKEKSEEKPEQNPEVVPEKNTKPLKIKDKDLEIREPEESEKRYDTKYIVKQYERYFRENQFKNPEKKRVKPQELKKPKPLKLRDKTVKPITDKKELDDYKPYEHKRIVGTRFDNRLREELKQNPEKKQRKKQELKKPKPPKIDARYIEPTTAPDYRKKNSHQEQREADIRRLKIIEEKEKEKIENEQKQAPSTKPRVIEKLDAIIEPEETEKPQEKKEAKKEEADPSLSKTHTIPNKKQQQKQATPQPKTPKTQTSTVSKNRLELREKYKQETRRRSTYNKKETKGFLTWLEQQKKSEHTSPKQKPKTKNQLKEVKEQKGQKKLEEPKEEWQILLEKWILEANISSETKEELLNIIKKYQDSRELYMILTNRLERKLISKKLNKIIEDLVNQLERVNKVQKQIFLYINDFRTLYLYYHSSDSKEILKEREKFVNYISRRLNEAKKSWKELINENLHLITSLSYEQKSQIVKIIQNETLTDNDKTALVSMLKKLPTEELIVLFGRDFELHTKKYVKWGWDFYDYIKKDIITSYFSPKRTVRIETQQPEFDIESWKREGESDSPFLNLFNTLVDILKNILVNARLIENTNDSVLEVIIKGERLTYIRRDMKANRHKRPNIGEDHLDKWLIRIKKAIQDSEEVIDKQETILQVEKLFDIYYQVSGYSSNNPLYREVKYLIIRLAEILNKRSMTSLSDYLHYNIRHIYQKMKNDNTTFTSISTLISKLETYAIPNLSEKNKKLLKEILSDYLAKYDYYVKLKSLSSQFNSFREFLIFNLRLKLFAHSSLIRDISDASFSQLFFGDRDYLTNVFLSSDDIHRRPDYYVLLRIKLLSLTWTVSKLKKEGIIVKASSLERLKKDVQNEVDRFMFKNSYKAAYINESPRRGRGRVTRLYSKKFLLDELELISAIFTAYAIHENNPMLTFKFFEKNRIYRRSLTKLLSQGKINLGRKTLKKIALQIGQFYREALQGTPQTKNIQLTQPQLVQIYKKALRQIISYKHARGISFMTLPRDYDKLWKSHLVKSYHIVLLFARQLGFDILTFRPLEDNIFAKTPSGLTGRLLSFFRRHHLDPSRKKSMLLQILLLTDAEIHNYCENLGTAKVLALLNAFNELVIKEGRIDADDIISIFTKHGVKDVYDKWYVDNVSLENLQKFNDRKDDLKALGIDTFMEKYKNDYKALYERFYSTFKSDDLKHIMLFVAIPSERNYSDWIATDYYFSKNPDLINYFTYNPQMFKYWFGD